MKLTIKLTTKMPSRAEEDPPNLIVIFVASLVERSRDIESSGESGRKKNCKVCAWTGRICVTIHP